MELKNMLFEDIDYLKKEQEDFNYQDSTCLSGIIGAAKDVQSLIFTRFEIEDSNFFLDIVKQRELLLV